MFRNLATLAVACMALLGLASAQALSAGSAVFEFVRPFLVEVASVITSAAVLWLADAIKAKLRQGDAITALNTAVQQQQRDSPPIA